MPRYFFHIVKGSYIGRDLEGSELPDLEAAREEAMESARELIADAIRFEAGIEDRAFWVRDEDGKTFLTLLFREVLP